MRPLTALPPVDGYARAGDSRVCRQRPVQAWGQGVSAHPPGVDIRRGTFSLRRQPRLVAYEQGWKPGWLRNPSFGEQALQGHDSFGTTHGHGGGATDWIPCRSVCGLALHRLGHIVAAV